MGLVRWHRGQGRCSRWHSPKYVRKTSLCLARRHRTTAQNRRTEPYIDPALISESGRTAECIPPIAISKRTCFRRLAKWRGNPNRHDPVFWVQLSLCARLQIETCVLYGVRHGGRGAAAKLIPRAPVPAPAAMVRLLVAVYQTLRKTAERRDAFSFSDQARRSVRPQGDVAPSAGSTCLLDAAARQPYLQMRKVTVFRLRGQQPTSVSEDSLIDSRTGGR